MCSNSEDTDQTPHDAVSDQGLHCLLMSHQKDAGLKWVNQTCKLSCLVVREALLSTLAYCYGIVRCMCEQPLLWQDCQTSKLL